ncbi:MAG TPA: transcriptional repressor [Candidatus Avacidaminococcus intestinavium]|uniref:Transcriptional repressor n=1 Tax=Candidatus Avacidaminococcus intestinavium TaxID=2840684 RepID=A0A9D1MQ12_9FIRM|nr:transcriptional repressor [Candidatus Avacidaminococcus intestinavium]
MNNFIDILRNKGYKITPQRRAVINALLECESFPSAHQVLECVRKTHPDISLDTIYRNLNLLVELGTVNEITKGSSEGNRYELLTEGHHHHIICIKCGKIVCVDVCPLQQMENLIATQSGFQIISHSLEFYGYCSECKV